MADQAIQKRPYGSGSVFYNRTKGYWTYSRSRNVNGKRVRDTVSRKTYEELDARLRELDRRDSVALIDHSRDLAVRAERRARSVDYAERVIRIGLAEEWTPERMALVIGASMAARRIKLGIFGPCVYCNDWLADTVDHVTPTSRGGTDDPANLVSACHRCNSEKHARLDYVRMTHKEAYPE